MFLASAFDRDTSTFNASVGDIWNIVLGLAL